jgi:hypothetical protein
LGASSSSLLSNSFYLRFDFRGLASDGFVAGLVGRCNEIK